MMTGKKLFIGGVVMIMTMMIAAVLSAATTSESIMDIYSPTNELGAIDVKDKTSVQSLTVAANNTQTALVLFNYQYVTVNSLPAYGWNYYYVDLAPNSYVSITHATISSVDNNMEIYMEHYSKPTVYSYSKKAYMSRYSSTLSSDSKVYSNRLYIAVRNANSYSSYGYTLSVRITTNPTTPTPTPTQTTVYRTNSGLALGLGIPALVITCILFFVVLSQIKKIKALTARIEQLEKKLQPVSLSEEMMPVMMNVPLMSANSLQQDHEEIQQQQPPMVIQPPTTAVTQHVPEQQPTTIPQMFPQFVQQQALPPQFRNAQPYPFVYPPQVVFAHQVQQQQQPIAQQQTGQTQTKQ